MSVLKKEISDQMYICINARTSRSSYNTHIHTRTYILHEPTHSVNHTKIYTATVIALKAEHHMHANILCVQVKLLNASALTASCHHGKCDQLKVVDSEGRERSHSCDMTDFPHKTLLVPGNSVQ